MDLLERDAFVAELLHSARESFRGPGRTLAVCGEAGIGKTALVNRVAGELADEARILWSGCEALFTPRPLGPLHDIAAELTGIDALLSADARRDRLFPAVLAAVSRIPTVLIVEDVHWADRATLDLLKYLARRITRVPLLLLLTWRDDEIGRDHALLQLTGDVSTAPIRRLRLPRLSEAAVEVLAKAKGRDARAMFALTGGNPFYLTEVLATDEQSIPPTVRDAVLARVGRLSPAARAAVELASVVPRRAERWLVEEILSPHGDTVAEVTGSGVVQLLADAYVFRHELGRRAVEDALPRARREALHAAVLAAMRPRNDIPPARLAHHADQANDAEAIRRFAPAAAVAAIRADAHREAAAHYRSALAHAGTLSDAQRADLLERLAYECYLTEQEAEAFAHRQEALALWRRVDDALKEGDTLRWLSRLAWFLGRNAEARRYAAEAIAVLERLPAGEELAMAWSNQAQLHMLAAEIEDAVRWGEKAIGLAKSLGNDVILAHALNNVGSAIIAVDPRKGRESLEESLRLALSGGHQEHAARAWCNLSTNAVSALEYERAEEHVEACLAYCSERDLDAWRVYVLAWRARMHLERGRWSAAAADAHAVLAHPGVATISRIPALAVLGRVRSRRGDPGAAALLDEAHDLAAMTNEFQRIAPVAGARAEAAWLSGEPHRIEDEAAGAFAMSGQLHDPWQRGELACWLWRAGVLREAPDDIAEPWRQQIEGDWEGAARTWDRLGRPYEAAAARLESGDREELRQALAALEAMGDATLAGRIRQKLGVRGPRGTTRRNPHGLTARELEIARLLAQGLRNADIAARLFVSAKTVDHHVSSVLSKVGAKTRVEAARIVTQDLEQFGNTC